MIANGIYEYASVVASEFKYLYVMYEITTLFPNFHLFLKKCTPINIWECSILDHNTMAHPISVNFFVYAVLNFHIGSHSSSSPCARGTGAFFCMMSPMGLFHNQNELEILMQHK